MAYSVVVNGISIQCETPDEALALAKAVVPATFPPKVVATGNGKSRGTTNRESLPPEAEHAPIGDEARKVLRVLIDSTEGLDSATICTRAHIGKDRLKHAIRALKFAARRVDVDFDSALNREGFYEDRMRKTRYSIKPEKKEALSAIR